MPAKFGEFPSPPRSGPAFAPHERDKRLARDREAGAASIAKIAENDLRPVLPQQSRRNEGAQRETRRQRRALVELDPRTHLDRLPCAAVVARHGAWNFFFAFRRKVRSRTDRRRKQPHDRGAIGFRADQADLEFDPLAGLNGLPIRVSENVAHDCASFGIARPNIFSQRSLNTCHSPSSMLRKRMLSEMRGSPAPLSLIWPKAHSSPGRITTRKCFPAVGMPRMKLRTARSSAPCLP